MKSFKIYMICAALCILSFPFSGWQGGIQLVHGKEKIDFSKIELGDSERKVIVDKAIKFYSGRPGGPAKGLTLGDTLKIFHIGMERIRDYQSGKKPEDVLFPAEGGIIAIYPPNQQPGDKSNIFSFVPLIRNGEDKLDSEKYQAGLPRNLPDYDLLYKSWKEIEHEKTGPPFGIFYPATGHYFLGYITESGEFKIKVLHDQPGYLKKGQNLKAEEVFVELAKYANKENYIEFEESGNPLERFRRFQRGQ